MLNPAVTPLFDLRPNSSDPGIVDEVWRENVYRLQPSHFQGGTGICVDLGANIGAFTLFAVANGARRVVACEPDPDNLVQLRSNLARHLPAGVEVVVLDYAVHAGSGSIELIGGQSRVFETFDGGGRPTRTESLSALMAAHAPGGCDFLKLDIEGSEYPVFEAASPHVVGLARRIALEFHHTETGRFGLMVEKLCETHHIEILGKPSIGGGYVFGFRYGG